MAAGGKAPAVKAEETQDDEIVDLKEYFGAAYEEPEKEKWIVTFFKGILGALVGALPGLIVWVVLGKYRIRAAIVGFFLAAGVVKGYSLFTKKNRIPVIIGMLICTGIIAGAVYLAQRLTLSWLMTDSFEETIKVMRMDVTQQIKEENPDVPDSVIQSYIDFRLNSTYGFTKGDFSDCFIHFHRILGKLHMTKAYYGDLIQSYISAAMGAASLMKNAVKKRVKF
ncbi:MAG: hypothetical protein IJK31_09255 [Ruminococcus sp.]|nr:hypothetical protein [Ruminococcus sp.]HRR75928.1 hypothetical protein [Ruminococcus sp.]